MRRLRIPAWLLLLTAIALHLFNPLYNLQFLNIAGVVNYLFYFLLGYFACRANVLRFFEANPWSFFCMTLLLSVGLLFVPDLIAIPALRAVNGIAFSISLAVLYLRYNCAVLNHLFGASYTIYLFSWFPQVLSQQVFLAVTHAPWWTSSILAFFSGLYIPLLIYRWIGKHRDTAFGKIMAFISGM